MTKSGKSLAILFPADPKTYLGALVEVVRPIGEVFEAVVVAIPSAATTSVSRSTRRPNFGVGSRIIVERKHIMTRIESAEQYEKGDAAQRIYLRRIARINDYLDRLQSRLTRRCEELDAQIEKVELQLDERDGASRVYAESVRIGDVVYAATIPKNDSEGNAFLVFRLARVYNAFEIVPPVERWKGEVCQTEQVSPEEWGTVLDETSNYRLSEQGSYYLSRRCLDDFYHSSCDKNTLINDVPLLESDDQLYRRMSELQGARFGKLRTFRSESKRAALLRKRLEYALQDRLRRLHV